MGKYIYYLFILISVNCYSNGLVRGEYSRPQNQDEIGTRVTKVTPLKYDDIENFKVKQKKIIYNKKSGLVEKVKYPFFHGWFTFFQFKKNSF